MGEGIFRLLAVLEGPLTQQVDRRAFAVDQADSGVPGTVQQAENRDARDLLRHGIVVQNGVDMLPEIALADARIPQEVGRLGLENPLRENPAELRAQRIDPGIAPARRVDGNDGHDRLLWSPSGLKTAPPER